MRAGVSARLAAIAAVAIALAASGCAAKRGAGGGRFDPDADLAIYRGRAVDSYGEADRFQVTLFARLPDRIHAEVSGPVGGPRLIVDGGDGQVAISSIPDRVAWVGPDDPEAMEAVFGVPVTLAALVRAVLEGEAPPGAERFLRSPVQRAGWPARIEVAGSGSSLALEIKRTRDLPPGRGGALGTGSPAPGMRVEPLDRLVGRGGRPLVEDGAAP